tara:strand:- start:3308 stop:4915 length:1608 start_codon:yes stop_codon:yes gene_type:complete
MAIGRSILKRGSILAKRGIGRRARKGLSMVRGAGSPLRSAAKTIAQVPGQEDGIQSVNPITKLVNNQVTKHVKNITQQLKGPAGFDPTEMLQKIFGGGLNQLTSFAAGLEAFKKPFEKTFKFLEKSKKLFTDFIKKLSKAKVAKGGGGKGGLLKSILKGAATLGLVAFTGWGISKMLGGGKKKGESTVVGEDGTTAGPAGTFQEEMGDQLTAKETEKFNKTIKSFDKAIKALQAQLKGKNKKPKEEEEKKEEEKEEKKEKEKESSLVGTKQTALIAGEDVPEGIDVIVGGTEETKKTVETDTKVDPVTDKVKKFKKKVDEKKEAKKKPEGVKRWLAGGVDAITGGRTDFDQQGDGSKAETVATPQDGISGATGKKGTEGAKGARGPMGWLAGTVDFLSGDQLDLDGRGNIVDGAKNIINNVKETKEVKPETATVDGEQVTPTTAEASPELKEAKLNASQAVAQAPETDQPTTNTTVLPLNTQGQPGGQTGDAGRTKMGASDVTTGQSGNIPFLMPFDTSNIHLAHSKQTFNIVSS